MMEAERGLGPELLLLLAGLLLAEAACLFVRPLASADVLLLSAVDPPWFPRPEYGTSCGYGFNSLVLRLASD